MLEITPNRIKIETMVSILIKAKNCFGLERYLLPQLGFEKIKWLSLASSS